MLILMFADHKKGKPANYAGALGTRNNNDQSHGRYIPFKKFRRESTWLKTSWDNNIEDTFHMKLENLKEIFNNARTVTWEDVKFLQQTKSREPNKIKAVKWSKVLLWKGMKAFDFCEYALNLLKHQVDIQDIPMCVKYKGRTIWLPVSENSTKKLFMEAAREKNPIISIIQFILSPGLETKNALNELLKNSGTEMVPWKLILKLIEYFIILTPLLSTTIFLK